MKYFDAEAYEGILDKKLQVGEVLSFQCHEALGRLYAMN